MINPASRLSFYCLYGAPFIHKSMQPFFTLYTIGPTDILHPSTVKISTLKVLPATYTYANPLDIHTRQTVRIS